MGCLGGTAGCPSTPSLALALLNQNAEHGALASVLQAASCSQRLALLQRIAHRHAAIRTSSIRPASRPEDVTGFWQHASTAVGDFVTTGTRSSRTPRRRRSTVSWCAWVRSASLLQDARFDFPSLAVDVAMSCVDVPLCSALPGAVQNDSATQSDGAGPRHRRGRHAVHGRRRRDAQYVNMNNMLSRRARALIPGEWRRPGRDEASYGSWSAVIYHYWRYAFLARRLPPSA